VPRLIRSKNRVLQLLFEETCRIYNWIIELVKFGESGKNIIGIGNGPKVQESMLGLAVPVGGISRRRRNNAKAQTGKK
jgi:hypothetical protein